MTVLQKSLPKGVELLKNPGLNKGTAFSQQERRTFGFICFCSPLAILWDRSSSARFVAMACAGSFHGDRLPVRTGDRDSYW